MCPKSIMSQIMRILNSLDADSPIIIDTTTIAITYILVTQGSDLNEILFYVFRNISKEHL